MIDNLMDSEDNLDEFFKDWEFRNKTFYYGSIEDKNFKFKGYGNNN